MKINIIGSVAVAVCIKAISISQIKNSANDLFNRTSTKHERQDYQEAIADRTKEINIFRSLTLPV